MLLAAALALAMAQPDSSPNQTDHLDWWREAKFGMFIHWGLYAVPAGEWNGETRHAEWIRETAHIPIKTYEGFLSQFNPVKFDADAWAKMAKDAGMKYIVITSKHHDGFCLFPSQYTDWDVENTPYKKDILKQLADACKRQGIRFCTYHSIMDWHHPDYTPKRAWEGETWRESTIDKVGAGHQPDFSRFVKYLHGQVEEIATRYDPGIMWFDGQWERTWNTDLGKDLLALCRRVRPNMIVNNRVNSGPQGGGDYLTPEQEIPAEAVQGKDWETCMTMNGNWGYNKADKNFKSTKDMIRMLADIASKGGNYLMNIGPMANGEFPPESVQRLKEIGAWMKECGSSIYGTTASPFGKLPWGRCTQKKRGKDTTLYFHVFDWPVNGRLVVPGLGNEAELAFDVRRETIIRRGGGGTGSQAIFRARREGSDVILQLPAEPTDNVNPVIGLDIKGPPVVYKAPVIRADSTQFVTSVAASIESPGLVLKYTTDGSEPNAQSASFRAPLAVNRSLTLKAKGFHNGRAVTATVEQKFEKVDPFPAKRFSNLAPGLEVRVFEGNWDKCAEFAFMPSGYTRKVLPTVSIADDPKKEFCGRFFLGAVEVPETEMYRFSLTSDDGSKLWIDGQLVVNNDGLHSTLERTGAIALEKGHHLIWVEWFNKTGGAELQLKWARLGRPWQEIPASALKHGSG